MILILMFLSFESSTYMYINLLTTNYPKPALLTCTKQLNFRCTLHCCKFQLISWKWQWRGSEKCLLWISYCYFSISFMSVFSWLFVSQEVKGKFGYTQARNDKAVFRQVKGMFATTATFVKLFKKSQAFLSRPYRIPSIIRSVLILQVYCFTAANDFRGQLPEQQSILSGRWTLHLRNNMPLLQTITPTYFIPLKWSGSVLRSFETTVLNRLFNTVVIRQSVFPSSDSCLTSILDFFPYFYFYFYFFHTRPITYKLGRIDKITQLHIISTFLYQ